MSYSPAEIETVHTQETFCRHCHGEEFYKVMLEKIFFHIEKKELFGESTGKTAWVCVNCGKPKR